MAQRKHMHLVQAKRTLCILNSYPVSLKRGQYRGSCPASGTGTGMDHRGPFALICVPTLPHTQSYWQMVTETEPRTLCRPTASFTSDLQLTLSPYFKDAHLLQRTEPFQQPDTARR